MNFKCPCGKEGKYLNRNKEGKEVLSCNKHYVCLDYEDLMDSRTALWRDFIQLNKYTEVLRTCKENTFFYTDAESAIDRLNEKYFGDKYENNL